MVKPSDFRDKILSGFSVKYVWDGSLHFALISVTDNEGNEQTFKVDGLTEFNVYDDFGAMYISQVKMLEIGNQIYLSLDPFDELNEIADYDKDNIWFLGNEVTSCA